MNCCKLNGRTDRGPQCEISDRAAAIDRRRKRQAEHLFDHYPQLGCGEIESFVLAQSHGLVCLTNDRQAKAVARALGLSYLDLEEILRLLKRRKMLTTETLAELIDQIEQQDRTRIKAKEQILSD
jgi:predicted nucleic acid-binding protein